MSPTLLLSLAGIACITRLVAVLRLWKAPREKGESCFLTQPVGTAFYAGIGAGLERQFRAALLICLLIDAPVVYWLAATGQYAALVGEQFVALLLGGVANNLIVANFANRASVVVGFGGERAGTAVQVSMTPRRLADYTNRLVEAVVAIAIAASFAMVGRAHAASTEPWVTWNAARWLRSVDSVTAWVLYLQLGLLLLKIVFVRWRMPLPVRRTDDFRRWRMAWLSYHLRVIDALRVLFALGLLAALLRLTWAYGATAAFVACGVVAIAIFTGYVARERRRLAAVANDIKPIELVKEFPQRIVPEGRFLADILFVSPGNPRVLVPSNRGLALNIAHPTTYGWTAYLLGLVALTTWVTR
jgi:hypothetical protein